MARKTKDQIEKDNKHEMLRQKLQETCDKGKRISMLDFQKNWNSKNKEKITEMVKLDHTVLMRFGALTLPIITDKLYL